MQTKYKILVVAATGFLVFNLMMHRTVTFNNTWSHRIAKIKGSFNFAIADDSESQGDDQGGGEDIVRSLYYASTVSSHNKSENVTTINSTAENPGSSSPIPMPDCPIMPKALVGKLNVVQQAQAWKDLESIHTQVHPGGGYEPADCRSRHKVAFIIPFRNRTEQLKIFLHHMHPILMRQQLEYRIYVIEQADKFKFNRAMLFNVGFVEAMKEKDWDCLVFHDVDLIPEDDRNLYICPEMPRHMSVAVNTFNYKLPYKSIFGGVVALTTDHFKKVNGFSNQYWGWGGEDDDMSRRVTSKKLTVSRYSPSIARYTMIKHKKEKDNPDRFKILKKGKLYIDTDGLNNLKYQVLNHTDEKLFTNVSVALDLVWPTNMKPRPKNMKQKIMVDS